MPHIGNFPLPAYPKPLSIGPSQFVPKADDQDWAISERQLRGRALLTSQYWMAPVNLPQGAKITKLTLHGTRQTELCICDLYLYRCDRNYGNQTMAQVTGDWTGGMGSGYDDSIDYAIIDNENYSYALMFHADPEANIMQADLTAAIIDWQ